MCQSGVCNTDNFLSELRRIFGRHSAFKIMEKNRNQRWLDGSFRYDRPRTGELSMAALLVDISLPCQKPNEQCKSGHKIYTETLLRNVKNYDRNKIETSDQNDYRNMLHKYYWQWLASSISPWLEMLRKLGQTRISATLVFEVEKCAKLK